MEENKIADQSAIAQDVSNKIKYQFLDYFLVKPLEPVKVKKEFSKPVTTGTPVKDANDVEAQDFDSVETEVKEVDSDYRKGIVLKRPTYYDVENNEASIYRNIEIGDVVIFRETAGLRFDLLKDSRLIRLYDIIGLEK